MPHRELLGNFNATHLSHDRYGSALIGAPGVTV
jgi:hypothetical protein